MHVCGMIRLFKNPMHPRTAYVDATVLTPGDDLDDLDLPNGYDRVRVTLDAQSDLAPTTWDQVRRTASFRIPATLRDLPYDAVHKVGSTEWDDWFAAHWDHYAALNSDIPLEKPANLRRSFGAAIEEGTAAFVLDGFASLRGMRAGVAEAGWIGGSKKAVKYGVEWCIDRGAAIRARYVSFDVDDTDPLLWKALHAEGKPVEVTTTWELSD